MTDVGIDDNFIKEARDQVTQGTSALFLLTTGAVIDRVAEALKGQSFEVIATNLSTSRRTSCARPSPPEALLVSAKKPCRMCMVARIGGH